MNPNVPRPPQYPSRPPSPPAQSGFPWLLAASIGGGVFVLLAAALYSTFSQARSKARATICLANERTLKSGFGQYMQDYDQRLPFKQKWMDDVMPYIKEEYVFHCPDVAHGDSSSDKYGYAFNALLSAKPYAEISNSNSMVLIFESTNLERNASDAMKSVDSERHSGHPNTVTLSTDPRNTRAFDPGSR